MSIWACTSYSQHYACESTNEYISYNLRKLIMRNVHKFNAVMKPESFRMKIFHDYRFIKSLF